MLKLKLPPSVPNFAQIQEGSWCVSTGVIYTEDVDGEDPVLGLIFPSWQVNDY